jgi:Secretion system C-terminal sorting domain
MKRNLCLAVSGLLMMVRLGTAQSLVPTVVSTSGGFYSNSAGMLSFTIGELSAVETYSTPSVILTQGFQQSWDFGTAVEENTKAEFSFDVIPNPSDGYFELYTKSDVNGEMNAKIVDVLGKEIAHFTFYHEGLIHVQSIDLTGVSQGLYFVVLTTQSTSVHKGNSIVRKIQIVK